jgi:hypothetical protein
LHVRFFDYYPTSVAKIDQRVQGAFVDGDDFNFICTHSRTESDVGSSLFIDSTMFDVNIARKYCELAANTTRCAGMRTGVSV